MKLRKKNGEAFGILKCVRENEKSWFEVETGDYTLYYYSLAELNEEWQDYEEPKKFWYICGFEVMPAIEGKFFTPDLAAFTREEIAKLEDIGNYFDTEEEAEKAVEKLKAWKRLKDKGFMFESWFGGSKDISFWLDTEIDEDVAKDLDLLFGGEDA